MANLSSAGPRRVSKKKAKCGRPTVCGGNTFRTLRQHLQRTQEMAGRLFFPVTTNPGWPRFPFSSGLKRLPYLFLSSGFPEIKRLGINLRILGAMLDTRFGHPFVE